MEQDAILDNLNISKADFLGFSNGGHTGIEIAIRHPEFVNKMILASVFYKRSGASPKFWEGTDHVTLNDMPQVLRDAYLAVNNNTESLVAY